MPPTQVTPISPLNDLPGGDAATSETKTLISLDAGYLRIRLDQRGIVTGLEDVRSGLDYRATDRSAPLVSLVVDGVQQPSTSVLKQDDGSLTFSHSLLGLSFNVEVKTTPTYASLRVSSVNAPEHVDVQAVLWGPLATSIAATVGEAVGVVRDDGFAIGMRPLTDRTEGGWPQEYQDYGWASEVYDYPSGVSVGSHRAWSVAGRTPWGSLLRAFTFDYTQERSRLTESGYPLPVGPLLGPDGNVIGSTIALFGASPAMVPTVLSLIASGEGLPYPRQDGQWQKVAQASSQSFLVLTDLSVMQNLLSATNYAKIAGLGHIYSLPEPDGVSGPWESTGHYTFNYTFGYTDEDAAIAVDTATAEGIQLGVHTLSDFIANKDGYVQPVPDERLALGGRSTLTRAASAEDTSLYVADSAFLADSLYGNMVRVGNEFITYGTCTPHDNEWELVDVRRGAWRSTPAAYSPGDAVHRVVMNGYGGAIGGLGIIDEISQRLASVWNTTGILSMSFDGLESASQSGWGAFGMARLVNGTYRLMAARDNFITETSRMPSNVWDAITRASWGEDGTSMEQVLANNEFYAANFLPGMLGWIRFYGTSPLSHIEKFLARGAGLNAGAGYRTSVASLGSPNQAQSALLLNAIMQWETARNRGAFSPEQRVRLVDPTRFWHLEVVHEGQEWLLQETDYLGEPIAGESEVINVPQTRFTDSTLPRATVGQLYEQLVSTNSPQTMQYTITWGRLPQGLSLNSDTGGVTGIPDTLELAHVTISAYAADGAEVTCDFQIEVCDETGTASPFIH